MNISKAVVSALLTATVVLPLTATAPPSLPSPAHAYTIPDDDIKVHVYILADGVGKEHFVHSGTVEKVLSEAGVKLGEADQVSALRESTVSDKQLLVVTRMTVEAVEKPQEVEFKSVKQEADVVCKDPSQEVATVTEGKKGKLVEVWSKVTLEGEEQKPVKMKEEVREKPVTEVKADCKEPEPVMPAPVDETPSNSSSPKASSKTSPPKTTVTSTKTDWMRAAGIPESDWQYVDYIVNRESSWNPNAVNPSSGACGLAQSLPCHKSEVYGAWNDPVAALKWQYDYVQQRYGGYAGAYAFWTKNHWY